MNWLSNFLSAEWVLKDMPNGGNAVLLRTLWISFWVYVSAILIRSLCNGSSIELNSADLRETVADTLPWLGAIMGATYAALYTRFSSQWAYLADLYNQQMAVACTLNKAQLGGHNYRAWQAAFIEDAICMHLATKEGFAAAIHLLLKEQEVKQLLCEHVGICKVANLEKKLEKLMKE